MKIENFTNPGLASKSSFTTTKAEMSSMNLQMLKTSRKTARILVVVMDGGGVGKKGKLFARNLPK